MTHLVDRMREKLERRNFKDFGVYRVPREVRAAVEEYAAKHKVTLAVALEQLCRSEGGDVLRDYEKLKQQSKKNHRRARKENKKRANVERSDDTRYSVITICQGGAPGLGRRS